MVEERVESASAPGGDPSADRTVVPAHAKTNLRLRVLGRTDDGYHQLETIFLRLGLHDDVEIELPPAGSSRGLAVDVVDEPAWPGREGTPEGPDNLCWEAAERFFGLLGRTPAATIRLRKRIPPASGLGGGSADAAAVLKGLDRLHGRPIGEDRLLELAGELGSDVPFCLSGASMALGWERGRRLLPLSAPPPRPALILVPSVGVGTAKAYRWLDEAGLGSGRGIGACQWPPPPGLADWRGLDRWAVNDFEDVVYERRPEVEDAAAWLRGHGAVLVRLSGSGSAVVGYFDRERSREGAREAAARLAEVVAVPTEAPPQAD